MLLCATTYNYNVPMYAYRHVKSLKYKEILCRMAPDGPCLAQGYSYR